MTTENVSEQEKQDALQATADKLGISKAYEKLNRKSVEVDIPRHASIVRGLELAKEELRESADSNKEEQIQEVERQIAETSKERIVATLVPLSAMDLLVVQGYIAEANKRGLEAGYDLDIRLFMLAKAEQCASLYLALRQRENSNKKYFLNEEEVVVLDEETMRQLARLYKENFVLSDEERKNLSGAPRS